MPLGLTEAAIGLSPAGIQAISPAIHAALVTPNDDTDLTTTTRAVAISGAGALKVTMLGGESVVIPSGSLAVGVLHPLMVTRIWSTGTGATGIVAYW